MNTPHWQNDEPETLGRVRVTERLDFISKPAAKPEDREHLYLEAGEVLEALAPNQTEKKDLADRTKADRPGFVVVNWKGMRRMLPIGSVEWIK